MLSVEKLEQVFVSSTYTDLIEERQEVIQSLLEADCIPAGMELFPASSDDRWSLIQRVIDNSDYYIVVIGGRYGSIDEASGLSFTEREYDYAQGHGKPIMAFLHGAPGEIKVNKSELDPKAREQLQAFRSKVEGDRVCKYWRQATELGGQVAKSLIQIRKTAPAEGWVRGRFALTPEKETEIAELRQSLAEARQREATLEIEVERARESAPSGAAQLAQGTDVIQIGYQVIQESFDGFNPPRLLDTGEVEATWDEIIGAVGPKLFEEIRDARLDDAIGAYIERRLVVPPSTRLMPVKVLVDSDAVDTVKVQLYALRVIEPGTKKRGVGDAGAYWKLSPFGARYVTELRAVHRDG